MSEWFDIYETKCKTRWIKNKQGKWSCPDCPWAADFYEQGAVKDVIKKHERNTVSLHWRIFQGEDVNSTSFITHFAGGHNKSKIPKYIAFREWKNAAASPVAGSFKALLN